MTSTHIIDATIARLVDLVQQTTLLKVKEKRQIVDREYTKTSVIQCTGTE